jgi:hypothetical protein
MNPTVAIYRRRVDLIAVATGVTTMGLGYETGPGISLSKDSSAEDVGLEIIKLFEDCGTTVEHAKTFGVADSPVLRLAKASSWTEFRRGRPEYLTVTLSEAAIVVERWWRDGKGYSPASPRQLVALPRDVTPQLLGDILIHGTFEPNAEHDSGLNALRA